MRQASRRIALVALLLPTLASAGVGPSPFSPAVHQALQQVWDAVQPYAVGAPGSLPSAAAQEVQALVEGALADPSATTGYLAGRTAESLARLATILAPGQAPAPELVEPALGAMKAVLVLGFKTPPAHRAAATEAAGLIERITAVIFAPQPEPPRVLRPAALSVLSGIAGLINGADASTLDEARGSVAAIERVVAVIFAPQPEPPKLARELFNVLDDMAHVPEFNPAAQGP